MLKLARALDAVLVAEAIDRFIRNENTGGHPEPSDIARLARVAKGVKFATEIPLDVPSRSNQTKRGQHYRKIHSRTGSKKVRRLAKLAEAKRLRRLGFSYRQIGAEIGVHWTTIYGWLN